MAYYINDIQNLIKQGVTTPPADMNERERNQFFEQLDISSRGILDHAKDVGLTALGGAWDAIRGKNTGEIQSAADATKRLEDAGVATDNIKLFGEFVLDPLALVGAPLKIAKIASKVGSKMLPQLEKSLAIDGALPPQIKGKVQQNIMKASEEIAAGADEATVIRKHLDEIQTEVEALGYKVYKDPKYRYEHFGPRGKSTGEPITDPEVHKRIGSYVNIPPGSTQSDYVIAREEFSHALDKGTRTIPDIAETVAIEARAKLNAITDPRVPLTKETIQQVGDTYTTYLSDIIRAYNKGVKSNNFSEYEKLVDALPPADHKIWDTVGDKLFYVSKQGLLGNNKKVHLKKLQDQIKVSNERLVLSGKAVPKPAIRDLKDKSMVEGMARPVKERSFTVSFPDGTKQNLTGQQAVQSIAEATGKSKKTIQNAFAEGRPITGPNGEVYTPAGAKAKFDKRVKTANALDGYDGTVADFIRNKFNIDPRSPRGKAIREKLKRGHKVKGVSLKHATPADVRQLKNYFEKTNNPTAKKRLPELNKYIEAINEGKPRSKPEWLDEMIADRADKLAKRRKRLNVAYDRRGRPQETIDPFEEAIRELDDGTYDEIFNN